MIASANHFIKLALTMLLCMYAAAAHPAGIKFVQVPSDANGPALQAIVWTPCAQAASEIPIGPYVLVGRRNCRTVGKNLPLVVISHGRGGSFLGQHDLAEVLADAGFVVVAINHPGDTASDMSRSADLSVFVERPTDIKRLIDYMLSGSPDADKIDPGRIGFFGFSRGGYTGLVLAGGNPDFINANVPCPDQALPICQQIKRKEVPKEPLTHDARIKVFVLADPLDVFPARGNLEKVKAPIQLWASEFGGDGVLPHSVAALADALPQRPEYHFVPGAAHFAFLAPCPASLKNGAPELCVDEQGFDRVAFHKRLNEIMLKFFKANVR
jgi:predicted dienelactone hydrolase